jgi:hypothetical protein
MSVTFSVRGERPNWETGEGYVNLANDNARALLRWLGYDGVELWGDLPARDLGERCRERLRLIRGNIDRALPAQSYESSSGCRVIFGGRAEGYLHDRCAQILELAERAGDGVVEFS